MNHNSPKFWDRYPKSLLISTFAMLNGLYSSAASLDTLNNRQEATAANLAHINTPGHRRLVVGFGEQMKSNSNDETEPVPVGSMNSVDFSPGRIEHTGRNLDVSLRGDAFFAYRGSEGILYSRNGVFHRDAVSNQLVNADGLPLLDNDNQPINYDGPIGKLVIASDGSLFAEGRNLGQIGVFRFDDNSLLESSNQSYFLPGEAVASVAEKFEISQGYRELSNVNPATELISLIVGSRHYEASQRVIRSISDSIQENIRS